MTETERHREPGLRPCTDRSEKIEAALQSIVGTPFVEGNQIDTLINGSEIFPAMLAAISGAKTRIEFLTFVYWQGDIAAAFADAFIERRKAGVEVLVMLDGFGGQAIRDEHVRRMRDAGVEVRWFRPLSTWRIWQNDNRTHRKLLIIDGHVGFTGGVGIAAEWEGSARSPDEWRDNHYRITGPVVLSIRAAFFENWIDGDETIERALGCIHAPVPSGSLRVQAVASTAGVGWAAIARLHEGFCLIAEERLRIATPYFAPRPKEVERMVEALKRGVSVEVIMPGKHIDKRVSELASAEEIDTLLQAGARLFRYERTMFHHKLVSVDGEIASIGSANFNMRSALKDDEFALNVLDRGFCAAADAVFEDDLKACTELEPGEWQDRSASRRLKEWLSRFVRSEI